MQREISKKSRDELLSTHPIERADLGWYFRVREVSAGHYVAEGIDPWGRAVSYSGEDEEALLDRCVRAAAEINAELERIAGQG